MDITDMDCRVGRLVWNLWSLEWMLRNVLYVQQHPPHTALPHPHALFAAQVGDRLPENALTSYATLGQLIDAYNQHASKPVDPSLVVLRDTVAHGRVLATDDSASFALVKFTRPDAAGVTVETRYELTPAWLDEQIARVGRELDSVKARYRELRAS